MDVTAFGLKVVIYNLRIGVSEAIAGSIECFIDDWGGHVSSLGEGIGCSSCCLPATRLFLTRKQSDAPLRVVVASSSSPYRQYHTPLLGLWPSFFRLWVKEVIVSQGDMYGPLLLSIL
jgi:hypothetical protein